MAIALKSQGVTAARADSIVALYKKRRRRKKLKPINRQRPVLKSARAALAEQIKKLFDKERPKLAHQISTLIRKTEKSDDDRVEQIMGELDFDGWVSLVVDGQKILAHIVVDGSRQGVIQVDGNFTPSMLDQVNEAATEWAEGRAAELVGMKYEADGTLATNPDAEMAITDSTRELLRADIAAAIDEGMSPSQLADRLEESYAFSSDRAETIATNRDRGRRYSRILDRLRRIGRSRWKGIDSIRQPWRSLTSATTRPTWASCPWTTTLEAWAIRRIIRIASATSCRFWRRSKIWRLTGPLTLTYTDSTK
jgi:hypothetical protein